MASVPEGVDRVGLTLVVPGQQRFRDDRIGATRAGESGSFRKAAKLDGDLAGSGNLVDGVRDRGVADVGLVGAIEQDDRLVFFRVFNPRGELGFCGDGTGGIIGEAKIIRSVATLGTEGT